MSLHFSMSCKKFVNKDDVISLLLIEMRWQLVDQEGAAVIELISLEQ